MNGKAAIELAVEEATELLDAKSAPKAEIEIKRSVLTVADFPELSKAPESLTTKQWFQKKGASCKESVTCSGTCLKKKALGWFPFVQVFQNYQWKQWFLLDLMAGLTIGIMHVPQGMGFALLANMPPIYGLYSSFFPVIIYFFFTSSRHTSFGTMSLVAMMLGSVVEREVEHAFSRDQLMQAEAAATGGHHQGGAALNASGLLDGTAGILGNGTESALERLQQEILEVKLTTVLCVTLVVGLMQMLMSVCRLGLLAVYFSGPFISGCNVGSACQIITTQVRFLLGIQAQSFVGPFKLPKHYVEIGKNISQTNIADLVISLICITVLFTVKMLNQKFKDKIKIPIPIDLIVVIIGTIVAKFGNLQEKFGVAIVGTIPQGIPAPQVPPLDKFQPAFVSDAVPLAIVGFCTSAIMAKLFAMKHGYPVDANQELFANGMANTIGSFFNSFCGSVAPPRTMLFDSIGGKTQFASFFGSALVLLVLVAIGPLFEALPVAVLSSIIVVALVPFFFGLADLKPLWRTSKPDLVVWVITCFSVILLDIKWGIIIGVATSCVIVVIKSQSPRLTSLTPVTLHSDIFVEQGKIAGSKPVSGVRVFRFEAPLYYANSEIFMKMAQKELAKALAPSQTDQNGDLDYDNNTAKDTTKLSQENLNETATVPKAKVHTIVLDCSCITYVDTVGQRMLRMFPEQLKKKGLRFALAGGNAEFLDVMQRADLYSAIDRENVYLSVADAVASLSAPPSPPAGSEA